MQCFKCATPLPEGSRFCNSCGADVSGESAERTHPLEFDAELRAKLQEDVGTDYLIERELGRGGMAAVYLATDVHLGRRVAVKVLPPELTFSAGPNIIERFKREARTAATLDHPHIIPIHRVSTGGKLSWYVMKYLEGESLAEHVKREGVQPLGITVDVVEQVADALQFAHDHGVIHRDVKPANVMLDQRGWVTVTDFGIAKAASEQSMTGSGSMIGTPYYMSPEQCSGKKVTGAADQYSLGIMAYEMLSGQLPFTGDSAFDIIRQHCMDPPPPLAVLQPSLPPGLVAVVERSLAKSPGERFRSVKEFAAAFSEAARVRAPRTAPRLVRPTAPLRVSEPAVGEQAIDPVRQSEPPVTPAPARPSAINRTRLYVALGAAVTLALGGVIFWPQIRDALSRPDSAPAASPAQPKIRDALSRLDSAPAASPAQPSAAASAVRPVELYQQACDGGFMEGCYNLGRAYWNGRGVAQSHTRAVESYRRACDGGYMAGCSGLGWEYETGRGVAQSNTRAVELFQRACDGGFMEGCFNLGAMYLGGRGVTQSRTRAVELFQRACDGGDSESCDYLSRVRP